MTKAFQLSRDAGSKRGAESIYGEAAPSFQCQDIANDSYKQSHFIRPDTQEVRIDVYDLDSDADPAPVPTRRQANGKGQPPRTSLGRPRSSYGAGPVIEGLTRLTAPNRPGRGQDFQERES